MNLAHLSIARVGHRKVPRVLTNEERMRAYRALAPVQFANCSFVYGGIGSSGVSAGKSTGPVAGASTHLAQTQARPRTPSLVAGESWDFDTDPPTPEEVAEAFQWKYGLGAEAD